MVSTLRRKITAIALGLMLVFTLSGTFTGAAEAKDAYPPGVKPLGCHVKTVHNKGELWINVNPNQGSDYYLFQVDVKVGKVWYRSIHKYKTTGPYEQRTLNRPAGTFRIHCIGKFGYLSANSTTVKLVR